MIVIPIAARFAGFGFPGWANAAWKLGVVAASIEVTSALLSPVSGLLALVATAIVFWTLLVKWFDVDLFGAVVVVGVSIVVRIFLVGAIVAMLVSAAG